MAAAPQAVTITTQEVIGEYDASDDDGYTATGKLRKSRTYEVAEQINVEIGEDGHARIRLPGAVTGAYWGKKSQTGWYADHR